MYPTADFGSYVCSGHMPDRGRSMACRLAQHPAFRTYCQTFDQATATFYTLKVAVMHAISLRLRGMCMARRCAESTALATCQVAVLGRARPESQRGRQRRRRVPGCFRGAASPAIYRTLRQNHLMAFAHNYAVRAGSLKDGLVLHGSCPNGQRGKALVGISIRTPQRRCLPAVSSVLSRTRTR